MLRKEIKRQVNSIIKRGLCPTTSNKNIDKNTFISCQYCIMYKLCMHNQSNNKITLWANRIKEDKYSTDNLFFEELI